ncbi:MAG: hypothetical protein NTW19_23140 [Planctomycetota bacterium]|nr:hypothetical protein [Planctomycetota bacterium]
MPLSRADRFYLLLMRFLPRELVLFASRVYRLLIWAFPALGRAFRREAERERRVLIVYDITSQSLAVGDLLMTIAAGLVVRETHGLDLIDVALVHEDKTLKNPSLGIGPDRFVFHLAPLMPILQVNPHLGSVFVFDRRVELERFIAQQADRYEIWPAAPLYQSEQYYHYPIFNDLVEPFFQRTGRIPHLTSRPFMADWARGFCREHVGPDVLVTVNIRNNQRVETHRNSDIDAWLAFFAHCLGRYPVKFVVVCAKAEIDPRMRGLGNVILAKDHDTGIEQELALVDAAAVHLGSSSGPAMMPFFSDKPYLILRCNTVPDQYRNMHLENGYMRFSFAKPDQLLYPGPETAALLEADFARLWAGVDQAAWRSRMKGG